MPSRSGEAGHGVRRCVARLLDAYLRRWKLVADGGPMRGGRLLPVHRDGEPAMPKIAAAEGGRLAGATLEWWDGDGAARLPMRDGRAMLLERSLGRRSLADMSRDGRVPDRVPGGFPAPRSRPPSDTGRGSRPVRLVPEPGAGCAGPWRHPGALRCGGTRPSAVARADRLPPRRSEPRQRARFRGRGWLAIDPKGVVGDLAFDFANLFRSPDLDDPAKPFASMPAVPARRIGIVAGASGFDRIRLLTCAFVRAGVATSRHLLGRDPKASTALGMAEIAGAGLGY